MGKNGKFVGLTSGQPVFKMVGWIYIQQQIYPSNNKERKVIMNEFNMYQHPKVDIIGNKHTTIRQNKISRRRRGRRGINRETHRLLKEYR